MKSRLNRTCSALPAAAIILLLQACFQLLPGDGGGQVGNAERPREIRAADIAAPDGYTVEAVMAGLTFPTAILFDDSGQLYVIEAGYSYGERWSTPRLLRVESADKAEVIAAGNEDEGPWTGGVFHEGAFYVADGSHLGRVIRIDMDGTITPLVEGLPSLGDHHTNGPAIGPDGMLYIGQGTVTNSGVVGIDNFKFGWLKRNPNFHDVPCRDITVRGINYTTPNPLTPRDDEAITGPFSPFDQAVPKEGKRIPGRVPCSGAIMRLPLEGGEPELVAWGFRNPFGLKFGPDGLLYVTENGFDVRGSRPVFGAPDNLWVIDTKDPVTWYGWPDYSSGMPVNEDHKPPFGPNPGFVFAEHPNQPPTPAARFAVHSSANGLDISHNDAFGYNGQIFVALFGDMAPNVGKTLAPTGYRVVRVNQENGVINTFLTNKGEKNAPASYLNSGGLERPVDVEFDPIGETLYVLDFGIVTTGDDAAQTHPHFRSGVLWRVRNTRSPTVAKGDIR